MKAHISLRIDERLLNKVKKLSDQKGITQVNIIEQALKDYFWARGEPLEEDMQLSPLQEKIVSLEGQIDKHEKTLEKLKKKVK